MAGNILWHDKAPSAEELAAIEAARLVEEADRAAAETEDREFRLMKRLLRLMHRRLRGEITQAQYIAQTDAIIAAVQAQAGVAK